MFSPSRLTRPLKILLSLHLKSLFTDFPVLTQSLAGDEALSPEGFLTNLLVDRRLNLNRRLNWLPLVAALAIVSPGCGDSGTNPEPKKSSEVAGSESKVPLTPKLQKQLENAKKADPRSR